MGYTKYFGLCQVHQPSLPPEVSRQRATALSLSLEFSAREGIWVHGGGGGGARTFGQLGDQD
jgi:hypothetical protein